MLKMQQTSVAQSTFNYTCLITLLRKPCISSDLSTPIFTVCIVYTMVVETGN